MGKLAALGGAPVRQQPWPQWPVVGPEEEAAVLEVLRSGKWGSLDGDKVRTLEKEFPRLHQASYGVAAANGTVTLEMLLRAAGVSWGDEVIVPAYTFVATASTVLAVGAVPVFADIDPRTYCLSAASVRQHITPRTRAIVPVHLAGHPVDMDSLSVLAGEKGIAIIEDCAQAHGAAWKGRPVGTWGVGGSFSFQSSKNLTCGEGGIVITNDEHAADYMRSYRNCGRSQAGGWYEHVRYGVNYRMTEFQAALLLAQMGRFEGQLRLRQANARYLAARMAAIDGIEPIVAGPQVTSNAHHLFVFRYRSEAFGGVGRDRFVRAMRAEGVPASPGYPPVYRLPMFQRDQLTPFPAAADRDYQGIRLEATEKASFEEGVWLPQRILLGAERDLDDVVAAILKIRENLFELQRMTDV